MKDTNEVKENTETIAHGKRSGRDSAEPGVLPGEFADDSNVNRFETPPETRERSGDETQKTR